MTIPYILLVVGTAVTSLGSLTDMVVRATEHTIPVLQCRGYPPNGLNFLVIYHSYWTILRVWSHIIILNVTGPGDQQ